MRPILCLLIFASLANCKPSMSRDEKIQLLYGEYVNVTAADLIIAEEAKLLGINADDHFQQCAVMVEEFWKIFDPPQSEKSEWQIELYKSDFTVRLNSTDEVLPYFAVHYPKTYAFVTTRIPLVKKYIERLGERAQQFYRDCWDHMLSTLVETSQIQADMSIDERRELAKSGWAMKKLDHYSKLFDALPEETKDDFEKMFCKRTRRRIMDVRNKAVVPEGRNYTDLYYEIFD